MSKTSVLKINSDNAVRVSSSLCNLYYFHSQQSAVKVNAFTTDDNMAPQ